MATFPFPTHKFVRTHKVFIYMCLLVCARPIVATSEHERISTSFTREENVVVSRSARNSDSENNINVNISSLSSNEGKVSVDIVNFMKEENEILPQIEENEILPQNEETEKTRQEPAGKTEEENEITRLKEEMECTIEGTARKIENENEITQLKEEIENTIKGAKRKIEKENEITQLKEEMENTIEGAARKIEEENGITQLKEEIENTIDGAARKTEEERRTTKLENEDDNWGRGRRRKGEQDKEWTDLFAAGGRLNVMVSPHLSSPPLPPSHSTPPPPQLSSHSTSTQPPHSTPTQQLHSTPPQPPHSNQPQPPHSIPPPPPPRSTPTPPPRRLAVVGSGENVTLELTAGNRSLILDLHPTRDLLGATYRDPDLGNTKVVSGGCEYQGEVRGLLGSWAALSLCPVIRGMIVGGAGAVWVEPEEGSRTVEDPHRVFTPDLRHQAHKSCGTKSTDIYHHNEVQDLPHHRSRRSIYGGSMWTSKKTRFVELVMVVDSSYYKAFGDGTTDRCKAIVNVVNALYRRLDLVVVLTHLEIWKGSDQVEVVTDSDKTLNNMSPYRRNFIKEHPDIPSDNMQLITMVDFDGDTIGKATVNGMCSYKHSVGIVQDHLGGFVGAGWTLAHEIGHNLGLNHYQDDPDCECPGDNCVMKKSGLSSLSENIWSTCSERNLTRSIHSFAFECLRNEPTLLLGSCGDGVVSDGEECDCGHPDYCQNPCCVPQTCRFRGNATCASGTCCDTQTCRPKLESALCREARSECDVPEYCLGGSEFCPPDAKIRDGTYCDDGEGHCYGGWCGSRELQCRSVWGDDARSANTVGCYRYFNTGGNQAGNCGRSSWDHDEYIACPEDDILCGSLHCESDKPLKHPGVGYSLWNWTDPANGKRGNCRTVSASENIPPTFWLVPDGATCGDGKMCVEQQCVSVPVSPWVIGFWAFVVVSIILVFLLWDHIRWWWERKGRACISIHIPPCAACCDACCCPCMNRINRMLASVLPSIGPVCKDDPKLKKRDTEANGTVPHQTPDVGSGDESDANQWGNSGQISEVVTFAPNKGKNDGVIENGNVLPYNTQYANHLSPADDWPLADKNSISGSSSDSPPADQKLLKNRTEYSWQEDARASESVVISGLLPDSPKIQPVRRAPSPPKKKIDGFEGVHLETRVEDTGMEYGGMGVVTPGNQILSDSHKPLVPPKPEVPKKPQDIASRPEIPTRPEYPQSTPDYPQSTPEYPQSTPEYPQTRPEYPQSRPEYPQTRPEIVMRPETLTRPEIPPRPEVILPLRPDIMLPNRPKPDVPP